MATKPKYKPKPKPQIVSEPEKPKKPRKHRNSIDPTILVAIVTTVGGIIVAVIALLQSESFLSWVQNIVSPPTLVSPTPTAVPYARVQYLDVIEGGKPINTIDPGGNIPLAPGSNVILKLKVVTNTSLDDLVFHWEFCHVEKNTKGQGAIEIPYQSSTDGADCVRVKIEKGGQYLENVRFLVSTDNSLPE